VKESSKSLNNWQRYKQEGDRFVHVVRLATALPKVEENAHHNPFFARNYAKYSPIKKSLADLAMNILLNFF